VRQRERGRERETERERERDRERERVRHREREKVYVCLCVKKSEKWRDRAKDGEFAIFCPWQNQYLVKEMIKRSLEFFFKYCIDN
jgi:hypothetical protein